MYDRTKIRSTTLPRSHHPTSPHNMWPTSAPSLPATCPFASTLAPSRCWSRPFTLRTLVSPPRRGTGALVVVHIPCHPEQPASRATQPYGTQLVPFFFRRASKQQATSSPTPHRAQAQSGVLPRQRRRPSPDCRDM